MPEQFTEFYSPFAHIPGRYEWCRLHNAHYGSFLLFIVIHGATDKPVTVYVDSDAGATYMRDLYPESTAYKLAPGSLRLSQDADSGAVSGSLSTIQGPIRGVRMRFDPVAGAPLRESPYGGEEFRVWGSAWSCTGVDLEAPAVVNGSVHEPTRAIEFDGTEAVIALGSYGHITRTLSPNHATSRQLG